MQVFNAESQKMVKILKKECQSGNTFDIHHFVTRCALDIICGELEHFFMTIKKIIIKKKIIFKIYKKKQKLQWVRP